MDSQQAPWMTQSKYKMLITLIEYLQLASYWYRNSWQAAYETIHR